MFVFERKEKVEKKSKNRRSRWGRKSKKTGGILDDFSGFLRISEDFSGFGSCPPRSDVFEQVLDFYENFKRHTRKAK